MEMVFFKKHHEVVKGVNVTRLPISPRGNNKITLMLDYFSYLMVAWVWMLFHAIGHRYDWVFVQQLSPVMMSAVLRRCCMRGCVTFLYIFECWI